MPRAKRTPPSSSPTKIRIIAGQWRGRKFVVPHELGLRPTGDRLRETLFNWLAPYVEGAHCLDAFAGTGVLGLEALSRGAASAQFIETNARTASVLRNNLAELHAQNAKLSIASTPQWLSEQSGLKFDLVFMDPPFSEDLWQPCIDALLARDLLAPHALIYVETPRDKVLDLPVAWQVIKQKDIGQVSARVYETI